MYLLQLLLILLSIGISHSYHLRHAHAPHQPEHRQLDSGCSSFTTCSGADGLTAALKAAAATGNTLRVCASDTPISCRTTKNSGPSSIAFGSATSPVAATLECVSENLGSSMCTMDLSPGDGLDPLAAAYNAIFLANPGNSLAVRGFELRGIRGKSRVAYLKNGASITFRECIFTDNQHMDGNTPVLVYDYGTPISTTTIENSLIHDNVGELLDFQSGTAVLQDNIFYNNRAVADQKTNFISNKQVEGSSFVLKNNKFLANDSTGARTSFWLIHTENRALPVADLLADVSGNCASDNTITGKYLSLGIDNCHNGIYAKSQWPYTCTDFDPCLSATSPPQPCDAFKPDSCGSSPASTSTPTPAPTPAPVSPSPTQAPTVRVPVTYYVDCRDGNDESNGMTRSTAWRDPAKATDKLKPGDEVLVRGGRTCPTTILVQRDGTKEAHIIWRGGWPDDDQNVNGSKAILWGGAILQHKAALHDTSIPGINEVLSDHPHYEKLYIAELPQSLAIDDDDINLYNGEPASRDAKRMGVAQWPNQPSPFFADDTLYYHSIPQDQINATALQDERLAAWSEATLLQSHVLVWVYGNRIERRKVVSYDQSSKTITFASLSPYEDRETKYALTGAIEFIDAPGEYVVVPSSSSTSPSIVLAYLHDHESYLTASTRPRGVDLQASSYNEFHSFDFCQYGGDQPFDGSAIYQGFSNEKRAGLRVTGNTFRHNYKRGGDTVRLSSLEDPVLSYNEFYENANQRAIAMLFADRALIANNDVSHGSTFCGGCSHAVISDNLVQGKLPLHANGIAIYQSSHHTVAARNRVLMVGDTIPLTIKESNGVCLIGNELMGADGNSLALWQHSSDPDNAVTLIHNYLTTSFVMSSTLASCAMVNNAFGGMPAMDEYRNDGSIHHNLHHAISWNQAPEYGWTSFPNDIMAADLPSSSVFTNLDAGDVSPARGAPSINAGSTDITTTLMVDILNRDEEDMYHPEAMPMLDYFQIDRSGNSRIDDSAPDIGSREYDPMPTMAPTTSQPTTSSPPTLSPSKSPSFPPSVSPSPTGIVIHAQPTQPSSENECSPQNDFSDCGDSPLQYFLDPNNGSDDSEGLSISTSIRSISRAIEIANANPSSPIVFRLAGGFYDEFGIGPWTNQFTERTSANAWIQFVASTAVDGENPAVFSNVEINHQDPAECRIVLRGARINGTAPGSSGDNNAIRIRRSSHVRIHNVLVHPQNGEVWEVFSKLPQGLFTREASNIILSSSEIIGGRYGVVFAALGRHLQVIDCEIHHQFEDAIRIASVEDVVIRGNHIHHVDDYHNTLQHIDGIQFFPSGPSGTYYYPQSHNVLVTENLITDMIGQMIFIQAKYVDKIGYMHNITVSNNVLGPKTVDDASCPIQVQNVKNYTLRSNTVVGKVLVRHESSGILLGNVFGELDIAEEASVLPGSDFNVIGELHVSSENTLVLGSSVFSTTTYANVDALDFAPTTIDACSGGPDGLHAGAVPCKLCEGSTSPDPIASFAVHPSRLEANQHEALLIPSSSAICGGAGFESGTWSVSDGQAFASSSLEESKSLCLPSPGIYSIEFTLAETNGFQDSIFRQAIRETPATEGLVAQYPLSSGFLADISPNKHDLATSTTPDNSTLISDGCDYDSYINLGYEDNIVMPASVRNSVNGKPELTAAVWAKPESPGQLVYKHVTVGIWIESSSKVHFAVGTNANSTHNAWFRENAATAEFDSFDGQWHHYAVAFNGTTVLGYIDGILVVTGTVPSAYASGEVRDGNWDMIIGHRPWKGRDLVGGVKDFRLFDRELAESEILSLTEDAVNCEAHALGCPGHNIFEHTAR